MDFRQSLPDLPFQPSPNGRDRGKPTYLSALDSLTPLQILGQIEKRLQLITQISNSFLELGKEPTLEQIDPLQQKYEDSFRRLIEQLFPAIKTVDDDNQLKLDATKAMIFALWKLTQPRLVEWQADAWADSHVVIKDQVEKALALVKEVKESTTSSPKETPPKETVPASPRTSGSSKKLPSRFPLRSTASREQDISAPPLENVNSEPSNKPPKDAIVLDPRLETFEPAIMLLLKDIYAHEFFPNTCSHYLYLHGEEKECAGIISVIHSASVNHPELSPFLRLGSSFQALFTHKRGFTKFTLPSDSSSSDIERAIDKALAAKMPKGDKASLVQVKIDSFHHDFLSIGENHGEVITNMKVAVIYVKETDTTLDEIFSNQPPPTSKFWSFMDCLGDKIPNMSTWTNKYRGDFSGNGRDIDTAFYATVWKGVTIIYHLAPFMDSEQHRRLVGNDILVIVFSEPAPNQPKWDIGVLSQLGPVPQIFVHVTPGENGFQLTFAQRTQVSHYPPHSPPVGMSLNAATTRDYLLTKLHNGFHVAFECPPLCRLRQLPRELAISDLGKKYLAEITAAKSSKGLHSTSTSSFQRATVQKTTSSQLESRPSRSEKQRKTHTLLISVKSGRNLASRDSNGLSDPYCLLHFGKSQRKTSVVRKSLNPTWQNEFAFSCNPTAGPEALIITVMDWDKFTEDDYMGTVQISFSDVVALGKTQGEGWFPLVDVKKSSDPVTGEILLGFRLEAASS